MIDTEERTDQLAEPPALPGRWTICAMLFVATTINYMDRQVSPSCGRFCTARCA